MLPPSSAPILDEDETRYHRDVLVAMLARLRAAAKFGLGDRRVVMNSATSPTEGTIPFVPPVKVLIWPFEEYQSWVYAWGYTVARLGWFGPAEEFALGSHAGKIYREQDGFSAVELPTIEAAIPKIVELLSAATAYIDQQWPRSRAPRRVVRSAVVVAAALFGLGLIGATIVRSARELREV